jgi:predicted phosphoribosyltransferase
MFLDRQSAGEKLAKRLNGRPLRAPLILAIPCGGVVVGSILAEKLGGELDVALVAKLVAPGNPEVTIGAVSEGGQIYLNDHLSPVQLGLPEDFVARQTRAQLDMLAKRRRLVRGIRPAAPIAGRSVIVADDGIVTGATILAALRVIKAQNPYELIVAAPLIPFDLIEEVRQHCDEVVNLAAPVCVDALGDHYARFPTISESQFCELLRDSVARVEDARQPCKQSQSPCLP